MPRPALSASRALEIIDLMGSNTQIAYTLSELVALTETNVASCHAILATLADRGYVVRHPFHKTYRLAPAIAAIGEAVAASDDLMANAKLAMNAISERTGLEALLTARAGWDIIGIAHTSDNVVSQTGLRVAQRIPLRPPFGTVFLAWSEENEIDSWIALMEDEESSPEDLRQALDRVRDQGFMVVLRSPEQAQFSSALNRQPEGRHGEKRRNRIIRDLGHIEYQPEKVSHREIYDSYIISAPIFDVHGRVCFALSLNGFSEPLSGGDIKRYAGDLIHICRRLVRTATGKQLSK